jgi:hypothetical protein
MRYRSVDFVELYEGDSAGPARRYTGLFYTRPASYDIEAPEHGVVRLVRSSATDASPSIDVSGANPVLRGIRGALWQTVFMREERFADLGGGFTFERQGRRLAAVHNGTALELRGAVIIDGTGGVYPVGELGAGERAAIAQSPTMTLDLNTFTTADVHPGVVALSRILRMDDDGETKVLAATLRLLGGTPATPPVPTLFGWTKVAERPEIADAFQSEFDYQFVRVVPDLGIAGEVSPRRHPGDATDPAEVNIESLLDPAATPDEPGGVPAEEVTP